MIKKPGTMKPIGSNRIDGEHATTNGGKDGAPVFDNWLDEKLRSAYSSVLDEPIPDDLIELIHQKLKD